MTNELTFKAEVTYSWITESDDRLKSLLSVILPSIIGNPLFPNSQEKAIEVDQLFKAYEPTVVEKDKQNSETASQRVATRVPLEAGLRELLPLIQAESGGSLVALLTTNIPLARNPEKPGSPLVPSELNFYLFGTPTMLYVQCPAQEKAQLYLVEISRDQVNWEWKASDVKSAVAFLDLPAGVKLYARMRVKNSVSSSDWSAAVPFHIPESGVRIPMTKRPKGLR